MIVATRFMDWVWLISCCVHCTGGRRCQDRILGAFSRQGAGDQCPNLQSGNPVPSVGMQREAMLWLVCHAAKLWALSWRLARRCLQEAMHTSHVESNSGAMELIVQCPQALYHAPSFCPCQVYEVLYNGRSLDDALSNLLDREAGDEMTEIHAGFCSPPVAPLGAQRSGWESTG